MDLEGSLKALSFGDPFFVSLGKWGQWDCVKDFWLGCGLKIFL